MELRDPIRSVLKHKGGNVWTVPPGISVFHAITIMSEKQVGALLVMQDAKLVGILSERDYARKIILKGRSSKETSVGEIMTSPVQYVTPRETVDECMRIMTASRVRHLPVVEDDKVVGIVSIGDLVNWIISAQATPSTNCTATLPESTPADPSREGGDGARPNAWVAHAAPPAAATLSL